MQLPEILRRLPVYKYTPSVVFLFLFRLMILLETQTS
jgi:hypothetical protein